MENKLPGQQVAEDLVRKTFNDIYGNRDLKCYTFREVFEELDVQLNDRLHVDKFEAYIFDLYLKQLGGQ